MPSNNTCSFLLPFGFLQPLWAAIRFGDFKLILNTHGTRFRGFLNAFDLTISMAGDLISVGKCMEAAMRLVLSVMFAAMLFGFATCAPAAENPLGAAPVDPIVGSFSGEKFSLMLKSDGGR